MDYNNIVEPTLTDNIANAPFAMLDFLLQNWVTSILVILFLAVAFIWLVFRYLSPHKIYAP